MVIGTADKDRVRTLLREAIPMMCRSGLQFKSEFAIEALVGITLDKDVFLVSIKETFKGDEIVGEVAAVAASTEDDIPSPAPAELEHPIVSPISPTRTKRKRRRSRDSTSAKRRTSTTSSDNEADSNSPPPSAYEQQPVLSLEDASLDNAFDVTADVEEMEQSERNDNADSKQRVFKQENDDDDDDSDELIVIKDEPGHNINQSDCSQIYPSGSSASVLPAAASSFSMSQFPQASNMCSTDMQPGPSSGLDVSGQLLQPQDPQQVTTDAASLSTESSHLCTVTSAPPTISAAVISSTASVASQSSSLPPPCTLSLSTCNMDSPPCTQALPPGTIITPLPENSWPSCEFSTAYKRDADGVPKEEFICNFCHMRTMYKSSMQRHLREKHTGRLLTCDVCGAVYRWKASLAKHKKLNHGPESRHTAYR